MFGNNDLFTFLCSGSMIVVYNKTPLVKYPRVFKYFGTVVRSASSHNDHCIVHRCKYWRVWYLWPGESLRNTPSSKGIVTQHLYPFLRNELRLEEFKDIITSQCGSDAY